MEITYIGHSRFKIKGKEVTLVIDPYDPKKTELSLPKLEDDVLLISHDHFDHNYKEGVSGYRILINGPGEYEVKGVFVNGISTFHDDKEGSDRGLNTMYLIEIDGITILFTGDLGHQLSKDTLEKIPDVDILIIPVGGTYTIDASSAVEVISDIEPGYVIPMHYQNDKVTSLSKYLSKLDKFLDEMGVENNVKKEDKLKISSKNDIPEETTVVILKPTY